MRGAVFVAVISSASVFGSSCSLWVPTFSWLFYECGVEGGKFALSKQRSDREVPTCIVENLQVVVVALDNIVDLQSKDCLLFLCLKRLAGLLWPQ